MRGRSLRLFEFSLNSLETHLEVSIGVAVEPTNDDFGCIQSADTIFREGVPIPQAGHAEGDEEEDEKGSPHS